MKKLDTSPIAAGIAFKPKGGTLAFLQLAYQEALSELYTSKIGSGYSTSVGYAVNGCGNTGSGTTYNIAGGSVFFNGEVFLVDAASFTTASGQVAIGVISTTQYVNDADPSIFTDGVSRNVHNIRKIVFQSGTNGTSGWAFNYSDIVLLAYKPTGAIGQAVLWKMPGTGTQDSLISTYFDGTGLGVHALTNGWAIANGSNGTDDFRGNAVVGLYIGDSNFGSIGTVVGENQHTLAITELPDHTHSTKMNDGNIPSTGGTSLYAGLNQTSATNAQTGGIYGATVGQPHNNIQKSRPSLLIQRIA